MLGIVVQSQPPSPPVGALLTKRLVKGTLGFGTSARRSQSFLEWKGVLFANPFNPSERELEIQRASFTPHMRQEPCLPSGR